MYQQFYALQPMEYNHDQLILFSFLYISLQLRFWVNMVNNPDMLFDINRSDTVLACMSVIGQTLMDSCSVTQHQLTPDSPSSKLLYAKDIQHYKEMVAG